MMMDSVRDALIDWFAMEECREEVKRIEAYHAVLFSFSNEMKRMVVWATTARFSHSWNLSLSCWSWV